MARSIPAYVAQRRSLLAQADAFARKYPPKPRPTRHEEDRIQRAVANHLRHRAAPGVVWFHVPNGAQLGGKKNREGFPIQAARLKGLGVRPGVSDIIAIHDGKIFALELKAPKGVTSEAQLKFIADVNAAGGYTCVAVGLHAAIKCLEAWGLLRGAMQ